MKTCNLCKQPMTLDMREDYERDDDADCDIPLAQWVCFCNGGNYASIEQADFAPQNFFVEGHGGEFQSVFPEPLADYSAMFPLASAASAWIKEVVGPQVQPVVTRA